MGVKAVAPDILGDLRHVADLHGPEDKDDAGAGDDDDGNEEAVEGEEDGAPGAWKGDSVASGRHHGHERDHKQEGSWEGRSHLFAEHAEQEAECGDKSAEPLARDALRGLRRREQRGDVEEGHEEIAPPGHVGDRVCVDGVDGPEHGADCSGAGVADDPTDQVVDEEGGEAVEEQVGEVVSVDLTSPDTVVDRERHVADGTIGAGIDAREGEHLAPCVDTPTGGVAPEDEVIKCEPRVER